MPTCRLNGLSFWNGNVRLAVRIFRNTDRLEERQPAIIVTGSWLTVKEQTARGIVWAAVLPDDGPTSGFFRDGRPLEW